MEQWCLPDAGRWTCSDAGFVLKHFKLFWSCLMLNLGHCSFSPSWFGSCFQDGHIFSVVFSCHFVVFVIFLFCFNLQPQPNKSPDDLFYSTAWWKPAGEYQSFLLQHIHCVWKLHEGGTSLCPTIPQCGEWHHGLLGRGGNLTSLGFSIVLPVLCSLVLRVWIKLHNKVHKHPKCVPFCSITY